MTCLIPLLLALASPTARAPEPRGAALAGSERPLVAAKKKANKKKSRKPGKKAGGDLEPAHVSSNAAALRLKHKKRSAQVFLLEPGTPFEVKVDGDGMLVLVLQRVIGIGGEHVDILPELDGLAMDQVKFSGTRNPAAQLVGYQKSAVTNAEPLKLAMPAGEHVVRLNPSPSSAPAVVEISWMPGNGKQQAPIEADLPTPEPRGPPVAPPPPAGELPLAGVAPPAPAALADKRPPPEPRTPLERDIRAGKRRDGVDDTYATVQIGKSGEPSATSYHRVTEEKPFVFLADGPGVVTVRVHRIVAAGRQDGGAVQISILEDDVLMRSVTLDVPLSPTWALEAEPQARLSSPKEYRIQLGAKLSRFSFLAAEMNGQSLAIGYDFAPEDKSTAMAVMGLGSELGLAGEDVTGATNITEVELRETVVERVVQVGSAAEETLGISVGAGAVVPLWGGAPAPAAGIELSLPLFEGTLALAAEGKVARHAMASHGIDALQARVDSESLVWVVPLEAGPAVRLALGESLRLALALHGSFVHLRATSTSGGGEQSATKNVWGAGGAASAEMRVGVGWWVVEAGYTWVEPGRVGEALRRFSPSGVEVLTRFRFTL